MGGVRLARALVGVVLCFIFGVNRIRRKAALLRRNLEGYRAQAAQPECSLEELQRHLLNPDLLSLCRMHGVGAVVVQVAMGSHPLALTKGVAKTV